MKKLVYFLLIVMSLSMVYAYSTYGAPSEFGNETTTTCYIGGDNGVANCTGNATFSFYFGDGSLLTGLAGGGDVNGVLTPDNYLYGGDTSGTISIYLNTSTLNDTIDSRASSLGDNSSWNQSLGDILYWNELENIDATGYNGTFDYFTINEPATSCESVGTNCFTVQVNGSVQTCVCFDTDINVNSSTYAENWTTNLGILDGANETWFEKLDNKLSLKLSQLTTWTDSWFGGKTTDDLTEGSTNLYDNKTWNQSLADTLYASAGAGNSSFNQTLTDTLYADISITGDNSTWNESYANTLYRLDSWDNFTGIPTATPSNGDTTHLSTADQIYDWVISLAYSTIAYVDTFTHLSNYTDDLGDRGYTSVSNFTNDFNFYNSTTLGTDYFNKTQIEGFSYYNSTDFSISNYFTSSQINGFSFYNDSNFPYTHLTNFTNDLSFVENNTNGWWLNFSKIFSLDWTNVTITESQISDLTHTTDTNETTRFNTLTGTDCGAGNYSYGFDANGLIQCREDTTTAGGSSKTGDGVYLYNDSTIMYLNETKLNLTIGDLDSDTTYTAGTNMTLTGTIFGINMTSLKNYFDTIYSTFSGAWTDLTGKPTVLSNFTDDLGDRGYTSNLNFTNDANYYNSTNFGSDYYNKTDIIGFGYYNSTDFVITDYYTSSQINSFSYYNDSNFPYTSNINFTNDAGYYNSTNPQPITDVWVNVTGDTMTGSLDMSNTNVTNQSYSTFCNGANCWKMYVNASDYFIIEEI